MSQKAIIFDIDHTMFAAEQTLHEGVADLLHILHQLGFKLGALSGNDHRALVRLDEAGIKHLFESVLCSDQMTNSKAVDGVQRILRELGVNPSQATLVSHAYSDVLLGQEVGLTKVIGVSHGTGNAKPLKRAGAHRIAEDIPGILDVLE